MADSSDRPGFSRRSLLAGGAAGVAGLAAGAAGHATLASPATAPTPPERIDCHGVHQAGIATTPQTHAAFVAFDLLDGVDRDALRRLMSIWSDDIARLTAGRPGLADTEPELAAHPTRLTITVAVGRSTVQAAGADVPGWLNPLPKFTIDRLQDRWNGGDLLVQVCADDELVVSHAVRLLTKEARTFVRVRWVQRGFRGPAGNQRLPRNLMGQVDGITNPQGDELDNLVWIGKESQNQFGKQPTWLTGGTTMIVRRIAMQLDTWDELDRVDRERAIGRRVADGVPLTGGKLTDDPDLDAIGNNGLEVIDPFAHVRRARTGDRSQRFLRRPYNYDVPPTGEAMSDSGLIFVTYQADLEHQFIPIQKQLAELDLLNEWTTPVGSAVFAVLPGFSDKRPLGHALLS